MIIQEFAVTKGETIVFKLAESESEALENGFPDGQTCCWIRNGEKYFNPFDFINIFQKGVLSGDSVLNNHIQNINSYYMALHSAQLNKQKEHLQLLKLDSKSDKRILNQITQMERIIEKMGKPDIDGVYRPDSSIAEEIINSKLGSIYNQDTINNIFESRNL